MRNLNGFDWTALILLIIGGVNWGLVGFFAFDLVAALFGEMTIASRIVYALVGLSGVYTLAISPVLGRRPKEYGSPAAGRPVHQH